MPTEKPRVTITVSQEELDAINDFRFETKQKNQSRAIIALLEAGLNALEKEEKPASQEGHGLAGEEAALLERYRELNEEGRERLTNYAEDLVASGRYQKSTTQSVG